MLAWKPQGGDSAAFQNTVTKKIQSFKAVRSAEMSFQACVYSVATQQKESSVIAVCSGQVQIGHPAETVSHYSRTFIQTEIGTDKIY